MNPFTALGLPVRADLSDAQVRTAWKNIAAATHPDRADGGNITAYTAAASAYAQLRTPWGRSEAYADLAVTGPDVPSAGAPPAGGPARAWGRGCCWSRPAPGTACRCGCWPAPWPPPGCPCSCSP